MIEEIISFEYGTFIAKLIPCEDGGYTSVCSEVPGAISQGETVADAISNLKDAIKLMLDFTDNEHIS